MPTNIAEYDGRRTRVIRNNEHILDDELQQTVEVDGKHLQRHQL